MSDQFWLSEGHVARIEPFFPLAHGVSRVDDRGVVSGMIHVARDGLRWRGAHAFHGLQKNLYNMFIRTLSGL